MTDAVEKLSAVVGAKLSMAALLHHARNLGMNGHGEESQTRAALVFYFNRMHLGLRYLTVLYE
jgi:hypothetical protein